MDILGAAESRIKSRLDKSAFDINVCVKDQTQDGALDKLMCAIREYQVAMSQLDIVKNLRSQIQYGNKDNSTSSTEE